MGIIGGMFKMGWMVGLLVLTARGALAGMWPGFVAGTYAGEQVKEWQDGDGVRVVVNAPVAMDDAKGTLLVIYALPNGNTIEQTWGAKLRPGMDWHFDIQHIAAQTRKLRSVDAGENVVVALVEAPGKSWPAYRAKFKEDHPGRVKKIVEGIEESVPGKNVRVAIVAHSGGGGFISSFINSGEAIPANVARIVYLDANYSYSDEERHGEKLLAWLRGDATRHLVVVAYDDREVTLNGKKIVSDTGGTWRASERMMERIGKEETFTTGEHGGFEEHSAMKGQVEVFLRPNPEKKILHTVMIGEMNAYLEGLPVGTAMAKKWGNFGGPRAYSGFVEDVVVGGNKVSDVRPSALEERGKGDSGPEGGCGGGESVY